jgi:hypothetical protein
MRLCGPGYHLHVLDRAWCAISSGFVLAILAAGCAQPPGGFDSPVPDARLVAITQSARTKDPKAVPHLIESLLSDDPLVRMAAINSLETITGQTLGYQYWAPEEEREARVQDWVEWYKAHPTGTQAQPGSTGHAARADTEGRNPV